MALLEILEFPDPRLRTTARPVAQVTDATRKLIDDMFETMYDAPGIGLAATQVNVHERVLVIDVSEQRNEPQVFINPQITVLDPERGEYDEGCLSVPGFYETVSRPTQVRVEALDRAQPDPVAPRHAVERVCAACLDHASRPLNDAFERLLGRRGAVFGDRCRTSRRREWK